MSKEKDKDQVDPQKLRESLLRLATLIQDLDAGGELLEAAPQLLQALGELRSKLFEYEVRCTGRLLPKTSESPEVAEAQRIVEEAVQRMQEAEEDWSQGWTPGQEDEDEG